MNNQKCYNQGCSQKAEMLCKCTSSEIFMCNTHISEHVTTFIGRDHKFLPIETTEKQKETITKVLIDIKSQTQKVKDESLQLFANCLSGLEKLIDSSLQKIDFNISAIDQQISSLANIDNSRNYEEVFSKSVESLLADNQNLKIVNFINRFMEEIIKITEKVAKNPNSSATEFFEKFDKKSTQNNQEIPDEELKKQEDFIRSWNEDFSQFSSRSPFWYCKKGIFEYYSGNPAQALNDINFAIKLKPKYPDALWYKSIILVNINKVEAISCLDELISISPQFSIAHLIKAEHLFSANLKKESLDCYNKLLRSTGNIFINYFKCKILLDLQRYSEVINCCNELIQIYPNFSLGYTNKGYALYELKKYEEASSIFSEVIIIDPNCYQAFNGLGQLLFVEKRTGEAITYYNEATRINPYYSWSYYNKGLTFSWLNKKEKALESWNLAIKFDPNNYQAYNSIGNYFYKEERFEDAINNFNEAIRIKPDFIVAHSNKGATLQKLKKDDESIECFADIIRIDPNCDSAYHNIGCLLFDKKKYSESIKYFKDAISIKPNNALYYQSLGVALDELGNNEEALECFNKAIEIKEN